MKNKQKYANKKLEKLLIQIKSNLDPLEELMYFTFL